MTYRWRKGIYLEQKKFQFCVKLCTYLEFEFYCNFISAVVLYHR